MTHGPWARHAQCKTRGEGVYRRNSLRSNPTPLAPAPPRAYRLRKRRVGGVGVADVGGRGGGLQVVELSGSEGILYMQSICVVMALCSETKLASHPTSETTSSENT